MAIAVRSCSAHRARLVTTRAALARSVHREELSRFCDMLRDEAHRRVALITYEEVSRILVEHGLGDLASDVERRIEMATA